MPALRHGDQRPRSGLRRRGRPPLLHPLRRCGGGGVGHDRHDAARDDARRHGGGREPRTTSATARSSDARPLLPLLGRELPVDRRRARRSGVRHRRPQDHAGARPHRLRHRPRPQAGDGPGDRPGRPHHRGRRAVRRPRPSTRPGERVVADLRAAGVLEKVERLPAQRRHLRPLRHADRAAHRAQWFMRMDELKAPATDGVREGRVRFVPERWGRVYIDWMENLRPWCISRQLWWGHQLPVWYCEAVRRDHRRREEPRACPECGGTGCAARPTCSTRGSARRCGRSPPGAGRTRRRPRLLLSDEPAQHGARDHLPVGGAHGDDGSGVHGRRPVPRRLHPLRDPGAPTAGA